METPKDRAEALQAPPQSSAATLWLILRTQLNVTRTTLTRTSRPELAQHGTILVAHMGFVILRRPPLAW